MERGRHPSGVRCYFVCFPVVIAGCPVGVCVVRWSSRVASLDHRLQAGIPAGCKGATPCLDGEQRAKGSPVFLGEMAEEVGFEPTVELPLRLISSQVPSTAQPLFRNRVV